MSLRGAINTNISRELFLFEFEIDTWTSSIPGKGANHCIIEIQVREQLKNPLEMSCDTPTSAIQQLHCHLSERQTPFSYFFLILFIQY